MLPPPPPSLPRNRRQIQRPLNQAPTEVCSGPKKIKNYVNFVQSIAVYAPEVQPWASALRITPLCAFRMHIEIVFKEAIAAHQRGDNEGRDHAASAVVRTLAAEHSLDVLKLSGGDSAKLVRYASLFVILAAEESLL